MYIHLLNLLYDECLFAILNIDCPNHILKSLYLMLIAKGVYIAILEDPAFY